MTFICKFWTIRCAKWMAIPVSGTRHFLNFRRKDGSGLVELRNLRFIIIARFRRNIRGFGTNLAVFSGIRV